LPLDALYRVGRGGVVHVRGNGLSCAGLELLEPPCPALVGPELIGTSPQIRQIKSMLPEIADCKTNVLITGETGTGKSVLARMIHLTSRGEGKPFIRVNCPSIPPSLFESEVFGHEKGAFTSADRASPGYFRLAGDGTILLDEISEIPTELQAKLLRVIEDKEYLSVGGKEVLRLNARIIATTNVDVEEALRAGTLREDLFYRLHEITFHLPPLRERTEDIALLGEHFLAGFALQFGKPYCPLTIHQIRELCDCHWAGNVRELENVIMRTVLHGHFQLSRVSCACSSRRRAVVSHTVSTDPDPPLRGVDLHSIKERACAEAERQAINQALRDFHGNRARAARELGVSYRTILRKIAKYDIPV